MWWSAGDDDVVEVLQELEALAAQVAALSLAAVAEADRRNHGEAAGATSTGNWLSGALRMRPEHAARAVKLARELDGDLAATGIALRAGVISADHAQVIARAVRDLPKEAGRQTRAAAEQFLLDQARVFHPKDLARLGRKVLEVVDPELADRVLARQLADEEAKAERGREVWLYEDPYSVSTWLRGKLDPVTTEMLRTALEPLAKPMPTTADGPDPRSRSQRLGDGFAELLRRYLNAGASPTQGGERPHVVITIDHDRLVNGTGTGTLLHTGTPVSARTAQEYACDAKISWYTPGNRNDTAGNGTGGTAWLSRPRSHRRHGPSGSGDGAGWPGGSGDREAGLQTPALHRQDPPTPRTPRPRLRLPRLRPPTSLDPRPPHHRLEPRRTHHRRQRRPVMRPPPPTHPPRTLDRHHRPRRPTRIHPTPLDRPPTQATPQPPTPHLNQRQVRTSPSLIYAPCLWRRTVSKCVPRVRSDVSTRPCRGRLVSITSLVGPRLNARRSVSGAEGMRGGRPATRPPSRVPRRRRERGTCRTVRHRSLLASRPVRARPSGGRRVRRGRSPDPRRRRRREPRADAGGPVRR